MKDCYFILAYRKVIKMPINVRFKNIPENMDKD